jgi:sugar phosphate isomerase/epimerase
MKYGAMNLPIKPVADEINALGKLGFDYIELTIDAPEATPEKLLKNKDEIKNSLATHHLGIVGHLPTFISTADLYESIRNASVDETIKALEAGTALGIRKFVLHPSSFRGLARQVKDKAAHLAHESLIAVVQRAVDLNVTLCIENMFPGTFSLIEPHEFDNLFAKHPNLMFTLDIAHAHIGTKKNRSYEFIRRFSDKLLHIHISDNYGNDDSHLPIGAGMIYFWKIFNELHAVSYDETMTLEVFSRDRDYLKMSLDKVRKMWRGRHK